MKLGEITRDCEAARLQCFAKRTITGMSDVGAPRLVHTSYDVFIPSHRLMLKIEELWIF